MKTVLISILVVINVFALLVFFSYLSSNKADTPKTVYSKPVQTQTGQVAGVTERQNITLTVDQINLYASNYCNARVKKGRFYTVPKSHNMNVTKLDIDTIQGRDLKLDDCRKIIEMISALKGNGVDNLSYEDIINMQYKIGVNYLEFISSVGNPDDINKTFDNGTTRNIQAIYEISSYKRDYFYFENSILTSSQSF